MADRTGVYWLDGSNVVQAAPVAVPTPVVLASGRPGPYDIAVDDTQVYWTERLGGAVMRVPKSGGSPQLVGTATEPKQLALDDTYAYWLDNLGVERAPKSGGSTTLVASSSLSMVDLGVDDTYVYVVGAANAFTGIQRAPKDGSGALTLLSQAGLAAELIAVDGLVIDVAVWSAVNIALQGPEFVGKDGHVIAEDAHYYSGPFTLASPYGYHSGTDSEIGGSNSITRMHECGGSRLRILEKSPIFPDTATTAIAVDDHYVYWAQGTSVIYRFPK